MTKIAAIQMCSSDSVEDNLKTVSTFICEAARNNAELIVLPEMFALLGSAAEDKIRVKESFGKGKIQDCLATLARQHKVWIVGGTIPIESSDKNKVGAACMLFDDQGKIVARYDKIHLFDVTLSEKEIYQESNTIVPGHEIVVANTPFGKLGLAVCYDVRFPELFRVLFNKGAEIIVLPSAFTVPTGEAHWELLARSRALENFCYLIGACQGGTHANGRKTYGHSIIVGPWGEVLAKKEGIESGVLYADIDLKKVYEARKMIPIAEHQRIFFDMSQLN
jgi:deaminated glutathione amidase